MDLATIEQNDNARPELLNYVKDIEQYDVIFLGYPIWWSDMPMTLYTFLDEYDLSGKIVVPFGTNGGSGFANTINAITVAEPNATVVQNGFTASRNIVEDSESNVISWLNSLDFLE